MAKIERKTPYQPANIECVQDPEVEGGLILRLGDSWFSVSQENLQELASGAAGDWQEYLLYQIGSRLFADNAAGGFESIKQSIQRAPFEILN